MTKTKIPPLYERLSREDELQGESNFISNQESICREDFTQKMKSPLQAGNYSQECSCSFVICLSVEKSYPCLKLLILFRGVEPLGGTILNVRCSVVIGH